MKHKITCISADVLVTLWPFVYSVWCTVLHFTVAIFALSVPNKTILVVSSLNLYCVGADVKPCSINQC